MLGQESTHQLGRLDARGVDERDATGSIVGALVGERVNLVAQPEVRRLRVQDRGAVVGLDEQRSRWPISERVKNVRVVRSRRATQAVAESMDDQPELRNPDIAVVATGDLENERPARLVPQGR